MAEKITAGLYPKESFNLATGEQGKDRLLTLGVDMRKSI